MGGLQIRSDLRTQNQITSTFNSQELTVHNEREFLEGDIDDLSEANKCIGPPSGQTYLTQEYGGLNRYLKYKAEKQKQGQEEPSKSNPTLYRIKE